MKQQIINQSTHGATEDLADPQKKYLQMDTV